MTPVRYSHSAMLLHWAIALLLAFQLALGWQLDDVPRGPGLFAAYQLHKTVGISILVLSAIRLLLRLLYPQPAAVVDGVWAQRLAKAVHVGFYTVMIGGPLTGWIIVSTAKIKVPTLLFGVIPWPHLPIATAWHQWAENAHEWLAYLGIALFVLHVAGALRHQVFEEGNFVSRMVPMGAPDRAIKRSFAIALVAGILALVALAFFTGQASVLNTPGSPQVSQPGPSQVIPNNAANPESSENTIQSAAAEPPPAKAEEVAAESEQPIAAWAIAPGGRLGFVAQWQGTPINGSFSGWEANIRFSPDALAQSSIRVTIDLGSARTGDVQRDEMLVGSSFFETATHPSAVFTSRSFRALGGGAYQVQGSLSLRGRSRPVSLTFTLKDVGGATNIRGTANLNRLDFGVGQGEFAATDEIAAAVRVNFNFSAKMKSVR